MPSKPIKYLVLSHHHSDHVGGFRDYAAEGAIIVTTAANKNFLEKVAPLIVAAARYRRRADALRIETIQNKKRVFRMTNTLWVNATRAEPSCK